MNIDRKIRRSVEMKIYKNVYSEYLNEDEFNSCYCILCGAKITSLCESHNPYPLTKNTFAVLENRKDKPERCCNTCNNSLVIPARFKMTDTQAGIEKFLRDRRRAHSHLVKIVRRNSKKALL